MNYSRMKDMKTQIQQTTDKHEVSELMRIHQQGFQSKTERTQKHASSSNCDMIILL